VLVIFPLIATMARMRELAILLVHLIATLAKCLRPGGVRAVAAESLLLKQQLIVLNRSRERAPNLRAADRVIAALCASVIEPRRLIRSAIVIKPSTMLRFHRALVARKYRLLFTPKRGGQPGPKGPLARARRRDPRDEAQESALRLPANRRTARARVRRRNRQRRRPPRARQALSTRFRR
jgi:hypothetical protein